MSYALKKLIEKLACFDLSDVRDIHYIFHGALEDRNVSVELRSRYMRSVKEFQNAMTDLRMTADDMLEELNELPTDDDLVNAGKQYFMDMTFNMTSLEEFDEFCDGTQSYAWDLADAWPNINRDYAADMIYEGLREAANETRTELEKL